MKKIWDTIVNFIYQKTVFILALMFGIGIIISLWSMNEMSHNLIITQALENAKLYAETLKEARTLYSSEAVSRAKKVKGITVTHDYDKIEGGIPLPATYLLELGHKIGENKIGTQIKLYSDYPFPWREAEGGAKDQFERSALDYLVQNPNKKFYQVSPFEGKQALRYAEADIMKPSCVSCHNTHPDSPKKDWKVGDVRGILEVTTPLDNYVQQTRKGLKQALFNLLGLSVLGFIGLILVISRLRSTSKELEKRVKDRTFQLEEINGELVDEQDKVERLLLNILPKVIADQLKEGTQSIAQSFGEVSILFADIVGFTELSQTISPSELVGLLNEIFSAFDHLCEVYGLEKIKTIGDAYMVASGLPQPRSNHGIILAEMALEMQSEIARFNMLHNSALSMRVGMNTGPVVAGVIGQKKFIYDLWGDAVNTASRMESHGIPGAIQITEAMYHLIKDHFYCEPRGKIMIKGKGEMMTYLLIDRHHPSNSHFNLFPD